jgi:phage-related protein
MAQRELVYVGRSERDLRAFPEDVQDIVVLALLEAMDGYKHPDAKPLKGFGGASVLEIRESFRLKAATDLHDERTPS